MEMYSQMYTSNTMSGARFARHEHDIYNGIVLFMIYNDIVLFISIFRPFLGRHDMRVSIAGWLHQFCNLFIEKQK